MEQTKSGRSCERCGCALSLYNNDSTCAACERAQLREGLALPPVPPHVWADREVRDAVAAWDFSAVTRRIRRLTGLPQDELAHRTGLSQGFLSQLENGVRQLTTVEKIIRFFDGLEAPLDLLPLPTRRDVRTPGSLDANSNPGTPGDRSHSEEHQEGSLSLLAAGGMLDRRQRPRAMQLPALSPGDVPAGGTWNGDDDGAVEALELLRRVEASDVGAATLSAIGNAIDQLCTSYTYAAPAETLVPIQTYQRYLSLLIDGRMTLTQRRELLRHTGWLSLLAATAYIDVGHERAAAANFEVARHLAGETGDLSLAGWTFETLAWKAVSSSNAPRARDLCQAGLDVAPQDSSAYVQLNTQLARVSARLGDSPATYRAVDRCMTALDRNGSSTGVLDHHFVCDERRAVALCAAAFVWLGEDNDFAEEQARRAVAQYDTDGGAGSAHRLSTARMNLALFLARTGEPSEASHVGGQAFAAAWRLCRTDLFLADTLDHELTYRYRGDSEVEAFRERYLDAREVIQSLEAPAPVG